MAQINKPDEYFNTVLYTGNGSTQSITGVNFQPDWVWLKDRDNATNQMLFDSVRGTGKELHSQNTDSETTQANTLTAFGSDGFSLGSNTDVNNSSQNFVAWNWLASNTTASNTDGSITSTVSANTTSGFSIVKFNTSGQSGTMTCGHGLNAVPKMIIVKPYSVSDSWYTYHVGTGNAQYTQLESSNTSTSNSNTWASTSPTSSVFSMSTNFWGANTNDIIAYCFAEKKGFSKFGSYVGNGSSTDGTFVYTGFSPSFLILKRTTDSIGSWTMYDNKRHTYNPNGEYLLANDSGAAVAFDNVDFLSNGFKLRAGFNNASSSYIYMAFAEQPLVGTNNIPATAR